jgi:hypothetical protein
MTYLRDPLPGGLSGTLSQKNGSAGATRNRIATTAT